MLTRRGLVGRFAAAFAGSLLAKLPLSGKAAGISTSGPVVRYRLAPPMRWRLVMNDEGGREICDRVLTRDPNTAKLIKWFRERPGRAFHLTLMPECLEVV